MLNLVPWKDLLKKNYLGDPFFRQVSLDMQRIVQSRDGPTSGIKLPSCMENLEVALIRKLVASTRLYLMDRSDAKMKWDSLQAGKVYNLLANLSSIDILFHPRFVKFESRYEMQIRNLSSREISN